MSLLERSYDLQPFSELRIRTPSVGLPPIKVVLHGNNESFFFDGEGGKEPRAEIFGAELSVGVPVTLPAHSSLAVFTPTGCRVTVTSTPSSLQDCYATTGGGVWMRGVTELHTHLEVLRQKARQEEEFGPRVLFVADKRNMGTSTYVKLLIQFAVRIGYHPLLLDAAVDSPSFGFPECLSLFQCQYPFGIEEGTSFVPGIHTFIGAKTKQPELFQYEVGQMAAYANKKMSRFPKSRVGGLVVDYGRLDPVEVLEAEQQYEAEQQQPPTSGTLLQSSTTRAKNPLDTLLHTIMELDIDQVFVVQSAWLRFKLHQRALELFSGGSTAHRPIQSSENAHSNAFLAPAEVICGNGLSFKVFLIDAINVGSPPYSESSLRRQKWLAHFFGTANYPLRPEFVVLDLWQPTSSYQGQQSSGRIQGKIRIVSIGAMEQDFMSTLVPMADGEAEEKEVRDACAVVFLSPNDMDLKGRVLAISTAQEYEPLPDGSIQPLPFAQFEAAIKKATIKGFAIVESVSTERMTVIVSDGNINKDLGICFFLCEEALSVES